ncbi:hypothetical protein LIER_41202 [Lithospermum erythrorhizon]|uniref:Putative plant transposon protein domain-containing protein n=1 Tax=Lithospermum erythrorhizon TaxID=34254 RepID=A0AAV3RBG4_LITER
MSDGPLQALEEEMFTAQQGSPMSGAENDLGGNSKDSNKTQVSPTKRKSSVFGKDMHKNFVGEDVDVVGQSVSQPVVDSVKIVKESVVGESSVNPSVTGSMNAQKEGMNESDDEVIIEKIRKEGQKEKKRGFRKMESKERKRKKKDDKSDEVRMLELEDEELDSERADVIEILKKMQEFGKLKINNTRTRVNNKRIPNNVAPISTDGIALNSKDEEARWKFIYNRRLAPERVLLDVTKRNKTIMKIINETGMESVVNNVGPHWPKLVREFICNLPRDVDDAESDNYHKVTLRNLVFNFSPDLINQAYGRTNVDDTGDNLLLSDIVSTLTAGSVTTWPPRTQLASSKLSVKYAVLHKVAVTCLIPTTHTTSIGEALAKVLYVLGSGDNLNVGQVIFYQIVDHARSNAVLKPIGYPSLICSLLKTQHPEVMTGINEDDVAPKSFSISHKLLSGTHVIDVPIPDGGVEKVVTGRQTAAVQILQDEIAYLDGVIQSSLTRKLMIEAKVKALMKANSSDDSEG